MDKPVANLKTLRVWRSAVRQRGKDLTDELWRRPRAKGHWNESLSNHICNDIIQQVEILLAAIDGLTAQAIERHLNGETGS
ncbi:MULTISPECIES: hypothetical protein [unclassified Pseudomonas]|uniref:hypothetical protein n=1 Tax=unclassified Pseudomonas TaxID=196821 RepID=UPI002B23BAF3|nr:MULTISPECIES: hypothetical protein [unclassified Pseudomonas]MEB0170051.1 hypothetical protein [Pseudomonas sp. CCC4.4]